MVVISVEVAIIDTAIATVAASVAYLVLFLIPVGISFFSFSEVVIAGLALFVVLEFGAVSPTIVVVAITAVVIIVVIVIVVVVVLISSPASVTSPSIIMASPLILILARLVILVITFLLSEITLIISILAIPISSSWAIVFIFELLILSFPVASPWPFLKAFIPVVSVSSPGVFPFWFFLIPTPLFLSVSVASFLPIISVASSRLILLLTLLLGNLLWFVF